MKKICISIIIGTLLSIFLVTNVNAQWKWNNPLPQGNTLNYSSFASDSIGWISGLNGCVLKTTNAGATFKNQYALTMNNIEAIAAGSENVVYVLSQNFLHKSINGGENWLINYYFSSNVNEMYFINQDSGWVSGQNSIYFTADGGNSWLTQYAGTQNDITKIKASNSGLVTAVTSDGIVIKSIDFGQNWTVAYAGFFGQTFFDIEFIDNNFGYISGEFGIALTTNGGTNWTAFTNIPAPGGSSSIYSIDFINSQVGYACAELGVFLSTTDGGATWNSYSSPNQKKANTIVALGNLTSIVGGENGMLFRSVNNGLSYVEIQQKNILENLNAISASNSSDAYAVGNSGSIIKTSNAGGAWSILNSTTNENLNDVQFINVNTGVAVGNNGTMIRTTNGGSTWTNVLTGITYNFNAVCKTSTNKLYAVGNFDTFLQSTNNGITWSVITTPYTGFGLDFIDVQYIASDTGFVLGNPSDLLRTQDGGLTWDFLSPLTFNNQTAMFFVNGNIGYVGSSSGELKVTYDGGLNWTQLLPNGSVGSINKIIFTDVQNGWLFTNNGIYRTSDGGLYWLREISPYPELKDAAFFSTTSALAVGTGFGSVLKRSNEIVLSLTSDTLCSDQTYQLTINTTGNFSSTNIFEAQLSDELGNFIFPQNLGTSAANGNTSIQITIPNGLSESSFYRIRVLSSNPPIYSTVGLPPLTLKTSPDAFIVATGPTAFCLGDSLQIYALGSPIGTYQWFKDGISIANANSDSLWIFETGDYTVNINNGVCESTSGILDALVSICGGFNEVNKGDISIFPNPTSGTGIIKWNKSIKLSKMEIFDITGKILMKEDLSENLLNQIPFDISNYENGVYFVRIFGSINSVATIFKN